MFGPISTVGGARAQAIAIWSLHVFPQMRDVDGSQVRKKSYKNPLEHSETLLISWLGFHNSKINKSIILNCSKFYSLLTHSSLQRSLAKWVYTTVWFDSFNFPLLALGTCTSLEKSYMKVSRESKRSLKRWNYVMEKIHILLSVYTSSRESNGELLIHQMREKEASEACKM